ncbi:MAG: hypothetical protein KDE27_01740 [Planctomycetes bacterium]|nr:hypothetical protein [Planctomycetota bacterium]
MTISRLLLDDLAREADLTRSVLRAVPADRFDWRPHDRSMTLGALASHIAETPSWIEGMREDVFDMASLGDYQPFVATGTDELLTVFERNLALCRDVVDGSDEFLRARWRMLQGSSVLADQPRHEAIRAIAIHHSIHHRGQLTVYLRLLDVAVPQTYGPTADLPDWRHPEATTAPK